jgi:dimethylamine monooxygenase subunit A
MAVRSSAEPAGAPYLPFEGGRFRLAMGLMPLAPRAWLEIDGDLARDLGVKRALLETRRDEVFAALPEAEAPAAELLALLADHLPRHHPEMFCRDGDDLRNAATGESWDVAHPKLHPLELCGRLVQEDFCLLQAEHDAFRLIGATLCSPSRWRLADKIGRSLAAIHALVPGYRETLERPVDRFFAHLKPGRAVWRLNWTIVDDPTPFQPMRIAATVPITADNAGAHLWLRVERQTLRRLAETGAVVFTIRTHITRLDAAIGTASAASELAALLRDAPPATLAYKHIVSYQAALLAWLDARALRA